MSSSGPVGIGVETPARANQLRYKQAITVLPLFTGYAAYYFCRSDLSVAMPLLIEDLHRHGMSSNEAVIRLGTISSFGALAYAVGKLFSTGQGDSWGGRRSFTIGLGAAIAFTVSKAQLLWTQFPFL
jgi:sugar phosphate permease